MTFLEAALAVLAKVGSPLHVEALTQKVLEENLLSHVGKTPQEVMESRLLAMARKPKERKINLTAPHTFALACWGMPEDSESLDLPVIDTYERNSGPLLRGRERDPDASPNKVRFAGRGERTRGQWREENVERRQHMERVKGVVEAALEILREGKKALLPVALAAAARDRDLISDDLGADALTAVLKEDNRKRLDVGKAPLFDVLPSGEIALHVPTSGENSATERSGGDGATMSPQKLMALASDQKRSTVRALLRRIGELDGPAFGKTMQAILERNGFTDLKVARRNRDGAVLIARKKTGLLELRYAIRIVRGNAELSVQDIAEHSRSLAQYGSQIGMVLSAAPVARDVIQTASSVVPPVFLFCGEALAQMCLDQGVGVTKSVVEIFELDEEFFRKNGDQTKDDRERRHSAQAGASAHASSVQKGPQACGKNTPPSAQDAQPANGKQLRQTSQPSPAENAPESEKKQAKAEGGEQRRLSKKERYRQRREAKEAARRMAAAAKAKTAALRAAQESAKATSSTDADGISPSESKGAHMEQTVAVPNEATSSLQAPKTDLIEVPESSDAPSETPAPTSVKAEGKTSEKSPAAPVYDPGKFGNFSAEVLASLCGVIASIPVRSGSDGVSETQDGGNVADSDVASEDASASEAKEKPGRRSGGRNRTRLSRRERSEKGKKSREKGKLSKSAAIQENTESAGSENKSEDSTTPAPSTEKAPRGSDASKNASKTLDAPQKASEESGQAGDA